MATHWETACHQGARSRSFPTFSVRGTLNRNIQARSHLVVTKVWLFDVAVVALKPPSFLFSRNTPTSLLPFLRVILEGGFDSIWEFEKCLDLFVDSVRSCAKSMNARILPGQMFPSQAEQVPYDLQASQIHRCLDFQATQQQIEHAAQQSPLKGQTRQEQRLA